MDMDEKDFSLAIVTGGAHRLGRVFALTLAKNGYAILLHYFRSVEKAESTAAEIRSLGCPVFLHSADLSQPEEIALLFSKLDSIPNKLKVLVNSAAIMQHIDAKSLSATDWDSAFDLNLRAPFLLAQAAAKRMDDDGMIINVTDSGSTKIWTGYPAYGVSKAGLDSLTRMLAKSYAPRIRVNAIAPGLVLPSEKGNSEEWSKLIDRLPLKKAVPVEDVSAVLEFLLNNKSITGQTIFVDSGYSLI
jgi:pteridine reductase